MTIFRNWDISLGMIFKSPDPSLGYGVGALDKFEYRWLGESQIRQEALVRYDVTSRLAKIFLRIPYDPATDRTMETKRTEAVHSTELALRDLTKNSSTKTTALFQGSELDTLCTRLAFLNDKKDADVWRTKLKQESGDYRAFLKQKSETTDSSQ